MGGNRGGIAHEAGAAKLASNRCSNGEWKEWCFPNRETSYSDKLITGVRQGQLPGVRNAKTLLRS